MAAHAILLIEDDEGQREPLAILFRLEGYHVTTARDGAAALNALREGFRPCVIVLDLWMPGMTGEAFRCQQMADEALCDIPVILYSSGDNLAATAHRLMVAAHAYKPNADVLLRLVAEHC